MKNLFRLVLDLNRYHRSLLSVWALFTSYGQWSASSSSEIRSLPDESSYTPPDSGDWSQVPQICSPNVKLFEITSKIPDTWKFWKTYELLEWHKCSDHLARLIALFPNLFLSSSELLFIWHWHDVKEAT